MQSIAPDLSVDTVIEESECSAEDEIIPVTQQAVEKAYYETEDMGRANPRMLPEVTWFLVTGVQMDTTGNNNDYPISAGGAVPSPMRTVIHVRDSRDNFHITT